MLEFLNPLFFEGCAVAFDIPILYWIQEHLRCAFLDVFMPFITLFGDGGIFWICWAALLLLFPKHRKTGLAMGIALILGVVVCNMFLKTQIARPRPYDFIENFDMSMLLVHEHGDKSFPSGHTIASFEAAVVLLYYSKKMGIPAMILAVLVSFSRLYIFVHYPTDVIASILLGTLFALVGVWVMNKFYDRLPEKLRVVSLPLRVNRGILQFILLNIITFGVYSIVVMSTISTDINEKASRYDGKKTMHFCLMAFLLSWLTCGIYPLIWFHGLSERISNELRRRGFSYDFGSGTYWGWGFFGSLLFGIGPLVYYHKLFRAMNLINSHHDIND